MVPPSSHRVSRVRRYSGYSCQSRFRVRDSHLCGWPSHAVLLTAVNTVRCPKPQKYYYSPVWPLPRSLATTSGISVDFSSSPYLDVSVQAVPPYTYLIQCTMTEYCSAGFPHSEIFGSMDTLRLPGLIAACHVLRRLLMPRHSPCALLA